MEMVVVLSIVGAMSLMAAGMFSGPVMFFKARRSMENLMWDIRKVQQAARSRGVSAGFQDSAGIFGIVFYAGQVSWNGAQFVVTPGGYSYLPYGPCDNSPAAALAGLPQTQRYFGDLAHVVNLDLSLRFVSPGAANAPAVVALPANPRIQFAQDIPNGNADIVPDDPSWGNTGFKAPRNTIDFQLEDNTGFFRIQMDLQRFVGLQYTPF